MPSENTFSDGIFHDRPFMPAVFRFRVTGFGGYQKRSSARVRVNGASAIGRCFGLPKTKSRHTKFQ